MCIVIITIVVRTEIAYFCAVIKISEQHYITRVIQSVPRSWDILLLLLFRQSLFFVRSRCHNSKKSKRHWTSFITLNMTVYVSANIALIVYQIHSNRVHKTTLLTTTVRFRTRLMIAYRTRCVHRNR